jgi:protein O-mannosyl-transferase
VGGIRWQGPALAKIAAASPEEHRAELAAARTALRVGMTANNSPLSRRLTGLLIVIAGLWVYHNSFQGPFIFDDIPSISNNPYIRHLWPIWSAMATPPGSSVVGRPVVGLTFALNYAMGGLNVWGYHAFNLIVHLLAALVLFGILRRTFEGDKLRDRFGAAAVWLAGAIALIWEVHPLQTESVTYIVQRAESLMGLFLLLTLYCTLRSSQSTHPRLWHVAAIVACALGMGSKEIMAVAPLIVLLYDRVFLVSSFRELCQRRKGLYLGLAGTWLVVVVLMAGTFPRETIGFNMEILTPWNYLKTETGVLVYYLRLCFWPVPLIIDYSNWTITPSLKASFVSGAIVIVLLGATLWVFRRQPWVGFLGAWFFIILAPTSSFIPILGEVAAERRMYLPLAAVVTLVVCGLWRVLVDRRSSRMMWGLAASMFIATILTLGWVTMRRNEDYRTEVSIWRDTVRKAPTNSRAQYGLGLALTTAGQLDEAGTAFSETLRLKPDFAQAQYDWGLALMKAGRNEEALLHFNEALHINPRYGQAQEGIGVVLYHEGKLNEGIEHFFEATRLNPNDMEASRNLMLALQEQQQREKTR